MRNPFGRRYPKPLDDDETTYGDWPAVPLPDVTITKQPEFHPVASRRKAQQRNV
jgi:hypothetical protein